MYTIATDPDDYPAHSYPLVAGAPDETSARAAYSSVNTLLDFRATQFPHEPFLGSIDLDTGSCKLYTFADVRILVTAAAKHWAAKLGVVSKEEDAVVIGVLAKSDFDYWVNLVALQRLGHIPLNLSITLSHSAVAKLLRENKAKYLLSDFSADVLQDLLLDSESIAILPWRAVETFAASTSESNSSPDLKTICDTSDIAATLSLEQKSSRTTMIVHSTGSTADPKSIPLSDRALLSSVCRDRPKSRLAITPLSHLYSYVMTMVCLASGKTCFLYPPVPYTYDNLLKAVKVVDGRAETFAGVPMAIKVLSDTEEGINALQTFNDLIEVSATLSDAVRAKCVGHGIKIFTCVASSETSHMLHCGDGKVQDLPWVEVPEALAKYFEFRSMGDGTSELFVKKGYPGLHVCNSRDGFATDDLYLPHPTEKNVWRYFRRKGEVIVHSSGVKSDPLEIEQALAVHPGVRHVIAVGNDRPFATVLIIPTSETITGDTLRHVVEKLNSQLPAQSRLVAGRWKILEPDDEFVMSPKSTIIRAKTIDKWRDVIDEMYEKAA